MGGVKQTKPAYRSGFVMRGGSGSAGPSRLYNSGELYNEILRGGLETICYSKLFLFKAVLLVAGFHIRTQHSYILPPEAGGQVCKDVVYRDLFPRPNNIPTFYRMLECCAYVR